MHYQAKNYGNFVVNLVQYLEKKNNRFGIYIKNHYMFINAYFFVSPNICFITSIFFFYIFIFHNFIYIQVIHAWRKSEIKLLAQKIIFIPLRFFFKEKEKKHNGFIFSVLFQRSPIFFAIASILCICAKFLKAQEYTINLESIKNLM